MWGECEVYEYAYTGPGSSYHPSNDVQAVMVGELNVTRGRLSGSVLADKTENTSLRYSHIQMVNDLLPAEGF